MSKELQSIIKAKEEARALFQELCNKHNELQLKENYPIAQKSYEGKFFKRKTNPNNRKCNSYRYTAVISVLPNGKMEVWDFSTLGEDKRYYFKQEFSGWEYTPKGGLFGKAISKNEFNKAYEGILSTMPIF